MQSATTWRRERDSNPRTGINRYTISNRAPSTNSAISANLFCCISNIGYYNSFPQNVNPLFSPRREKFLPAELPPE